MSVRGVALAAGGRTLLHDVSFEVLPGEFVAVVGPNGVGKTTLARAVAGFGPAVSGTIALDGTDVRALAPHDRARRITFLGSDGDAPAGVTVAEVALTGRFARRAWWDWTRSDDDARAVDAALGAVGLAGAHDRIFDTLSSGERQRAWLALALAQEAGTIVLDEPTSHLDARYAVEALALLREVARAPTSVVAVLHDLTEAARTADRVCVLGEGRALAFAPPNDALEPALLERAFGVPFRRVDLDGDTIVVPCAPYAVRTVAARR